MKWSEFSALLSGIGPDTALGRIVSIRAEEDEEMLKSFTSDMHRIRSEWRNRIARQKDQKTCDDFVEAMKIAFMDMAGIGGGTNLESKADMSALRPCTEGTVHARRRVPGSFYQVPGQTVQKNF